MTTIPGTDTAGFVFKHLPLDVPPKTLIELVSCVKEIRRAVGQPAGCECEGTVHLACAIRKVLDDNKAVHDLGL